MSVIHLDLEHKDRRKDNLRKCVFDTMVGFGR